MVVAPTEIRTDADTRLIESTGSVKIQMNTCRENRLVIFILKQKGILKKLLLSRDEKTPRGHTTQLATKICMYFVIAQIYI